MKLFAKLSKAETRAIDKTAEGYAKFLGLQLNTSQQMSQVVAIHRDAMLNTKLILIEGLPGAGKSTTTEYLGNLLQARGVPCRWFREEDDPHPIPCLEFQIRGLRQRMIPLWEGLVEHARHEPAITILESRLWQNTALYMFMSEVSEAEIIQYLREVGNVLGPLDPALIHLDQEDTEAALRHLSAIRGEKWMEDALRETTQYAWFKSRDLADFAGWVKFFEEWTDLAHLLYDEWPYSKVRILNAHDDWGKARKNIERFLETGRN